MTDLTTTDIADIAWAVVMLVGLLHIIAWSRK